MKTPQVLNLSDTESYRKDLYKIAIITSVGWGIISSFPLAVLRRPFPARDEREFQRMEQTPRNIPFPPKHNPVLSFSGVTIMILSLWALNIFLRSRLDKIKASEKVRNITRYGLSYLLTIVVYYVCVSLLSLVVANNRPMFFPLIVALTNNTIVVVLLDLIILQKKKSQVELENTQLRMNSVIAQHQNLKHQLHPHFLFNSLNTLKSLIKKQPLEAEDYLVRLSDLLRSSISADSQNTVGLKQELKLCVDYLEMQKVRFKTAFDYQIDVPDSIIQTGLMPVFSLQLLVENAIKHNAFTTDEPLHMTISYTGEDSIKVSNYKKLKPFTEPSSGIGLKNLSERFKVISGHDIVITETDSMFAVELKILHG